MPTKLPPRPRPQKKRSSTSKKPASADPFAPAHRQELESGSLSLYFDSGEFDGDLDVVAAFESEDLEGSGYDWEAVLAPALKTHDRKAFKAIEWSPESDTFVAIAETEAPLVALAEVLRKVLATQASLEKAVAKHDPERT